MNDLEQHLERIEQELRARSATNPALADLAAVRAHLAELQAAPSWIAKTTATVEIADWEICIPKLERKRLHAQPCQVCKARTGEIHGDYCSVLG